LFQYINDFVESANTIDGYGIFYKNVRATVLAQGMSKTQVKKYRNHKIVPAAFFIFLREAGIIKPTVKVSQGGTSKDEFERILKQNHIQSEQERSVNEYREKLRIKKYCDPELNKSFAENHIWQG
jgi:hypothetical protein